MEDKKGTKKEIKTSYQNREGVIEYKENPFGKEMLNTIKTGNKITGFASKSIDVVDRQSGEYLGDSAVIGIKRKVDQEEFIKFFGAGLVSAFELSKTARDMFLMLMRLYLEVDTTKASNIDQIYINFHIAADDFGYTKTRQTFINGINQLIQKKIIAPVKYKKDWYWLNPNLFIKGNRVTLIQQYEMTGDEEQGELDLEDKKEYLEKIKNNGEKK